MTSRSAGLPGSSRPSTRIAQRACRVHAGCPERPRDVDGLLGVEGAPARRPRRIAAAHGRRQVAPRVGRLDRRVGAERDERAGTSRGRRSGTHAAIARPMRGRRRARRSTGGTAARTPRYQRARTGAYPPGPPAGRAPRDAATPVRRGDPLQDVQRSAHGRVPDAVDLDRDADAPRRRARRPQHRRRVVGHHARRATHRRAARVVRLVRRQERGAPGAQRAVREQLQPAIAVAPARPGPCASRRRWRRQLDLADRRSHPQRQPTLAPPATRYSPMASIERRVTARSPGSWTPVTPRAASVAGVSLQRGGPSAAVSQPG